MIRTLNTAMYLMFYASSKSLKVKHTQRTNNGGETDCSMSPRTRLQEGMEEQDETTAV